VQRRPQGAEPRTKATDSTEVRDRVCPFERSGRTAGLPHSRLAERREMSSSRRLDGAFAEPTGGGRGPHAMPRAEPMWCAAPDLKTHALEHGPQGASKHADPAYAHLP